MEYGFELPDGRWLHKAANEFRDEAHAREWAGLANVNFKGAFKAPDTSNAPGSASWCETFGDNR